MKLIPITFLLVAAALARAPRHLADTFTTDLNADLSELLNRYPAGKSFKIFEKRHGDKAKARQLAGVAYAELQSKYNALKDKYHNLLSVFKAKGYLSNTVQSKRVNELDLSRVPEKHARRLVTLQQQAQAHKRKMQCINDNYGFDDFIPDADFMPDANDSWLTTAVKQTANSLGIQTQSDALIAGAGAGALAYGVHTHNNMSDLKRMQALKLQKMYVMKEKLSLQFSTQIKLLSRFVEGLEANSRRVSSVSDNICTQISNQMMYIDGGY